jgi:hypothetical protein
MTLGSRYTISRDGGSALVEVIAHGLTLQENKRLEKGIRVKVISVLKTIHQQRAAIPGDYIDVYDPSEWMIKPFHTGKEEQLTLLDARIL